MGEFGRLVAVPLRSTSAWPDEARDFTPWLFRNLDRLGEALNLVLEPVARESAAGTLSVDVVAQTVPDNRLVVIENQLEDTDHGHLGQLMAYAAVKEAGVVVWISPHFRDEHRQALDWLNRQTPKGLDFYGVQLELYRIDESPPAPRFTLVAYPNQLVKGTPRARGRAWDEETFVADLATRAGSGAVEAARALIAWSRERGLLEWWGNGASDGSYVPQLVINGEEHFLFTLWTYGRLELNLQYMSLGPFADPERRRDLSLRVEAAAGQPLKGSHDSGRPRLDLRRLGPDAIRGLEAVLDWYLGVVREAAVGQ